VLQYVQRLSDTLKSSPPTEQDEATDPLADFVGAVSHGSLATNLAKGDRVI
jgi:hypothetical protein